MEEIEILLHENGKALHQVTQRNVEAASLVVFTARLDRAFLSKLV